MKYLLVVKFDVHPMGCVQKDAKQKRDREKEGAGEREREQRKHPSEWKKFDEAKRDE